jgi:uncharacterized protein YjiS (DUF1127 family)
MRAINSESIDLDHGRPSILNRMALRVTAVAEIWIERHRQRQTLCGLSDHVLKDIGVSRSEAEHEARKPFWRG